MMFYVLLVNQDATTGTYTGMSYDDAEALFERFSQRANTAYCMWGDAGGDMINTFVKDVEEWL